MIRLKMLGGLDLRDGEGRELRALLAQPKRLALLAYIALANGAAFRRRDSVVALFWPELDDEHARGSLRQALTFLRRTLGDGVIVTRGEEEIGLDRVALWCDTTAFLEAADAGRHAEALELYRGDFLDGFFVSDAAPEFERWLEGQRSALRRRAAGAAWALAQASRVGGDRAQAGVHARRAAGFAPDDEAELARLIVFLDELGDRAGAMGAYDEFARRLRREYDAVPAPETQALMRSIRTRAAPVGGDVAVASARHPAEAGQRSVVAGTVAWRRGVGARAAIYLAALGLVALAGYLLAGKVPWRAPAQPTVAVLPFDDLSGDTAQVYVADGLTDQLITDLAQTGALQVINRRTMMVYRDSVKTNRAIARALGADAVVSGTVQRIGDTVHMTAQLVLAGEDRAAWAIPLEGSRGDLLRMQREVARAVTRQLRIALPAARATALTGARRVDPEAFDLYNRGRHWWNRRGKANLLRSIELFAQALDVDPTFALPHSGMADAYVQLGYGSYLAPSDAFPKAAEAARRALALDSNLAEPHAALAYVAMYYTWDWAAADREFKHSLALNPSYATAHEWYGLFLTAMGRFDEALSHERRAQELDPLATPIAGTAGWVLHYSGRQDDAERELRIALRVDSTFAIGHLYLGRVYQAKGHLDSALAEYAATGVLRDWVPTVAGEGYVYGLQNRTRDALAALAKMDAVARRGEYVTAYAVALIHAAMGQPDSAFAWLDQAIRERTHWLVWLNRDTRWAPLRADPRFAELAGRVGLPR